MFVPHVSVRLYRPVALALEARGIPSDAVFAEFGMPPPREAGWDVRAPLPQIAGIWDRLLSVTGDPHFALQAARHVDLTTCDVITYLEANAATLREALERKFEYLALMTDAIAWTLEVNGAEAVLTLHERPPRPPLAPVAEYLLGARHAFLQKFGPSAWSLRFVTFRHAAPHDAQPHAQLFGVTPRFEAADDQLGFDAALLDAPMRRRDDSLSELLARYAELAASVAPGGPSFTDRVRDVLRSGADPGIAEVARRLGVAPRTLQRALKNEGSTYLEISTRMRHAAAERLLLRRELAVSEIAFALGFNDAPAFHHAFVRWTGLTPGGFRKRHFGQAYVEPPFGRLLRAQE